MCGKDEARREVYKPKEEPERGDRRRKRKKERTKKGRKNEREERKKRKWWDSQKKDTCETDLVLETGLEGNLRGK